jgi:hypothetical protein
LSTQPFNQFCPVCRYPGVEAYDQYACSTFEICPCCGNEFGYDDATRSHAQLRLEWIAAGMPWWSTATKPPAGWDARHQLGNGDYPITEEGATQP